jgi:hypothetical protein
MKPATLTIYSGAVLLLALLAGCGGASTGNSSYPTATALAPTFTSTPTTAAAYSCPPGAPSLANIRDGGEGATLDTFAGRWGPQAGVALGNIAFGRYSDTGQQKMLVPSYLPASNRVWTVQYFVDTTQQVSISDAAAIATSVVAGQADLHCGVA